MIKIPEVKTIDDNFSFEERYLRYEGKPVQVRGISVLRANGAVERKPFSFEDVWESVDPQIFLGQQCRAYFDIRTDGLAEHIEEIYHQGQRIYYSPSMN